MKTSHSSRGTFRNCKRKFYWSYIKELEQDRKPKALRMGSMWSDALEHGIHSVIDSYGKLYYTCPEWEIDELGHELEIIKALHSTYPFDIGEKREVPFRHVTQTYEDRGQLDGVKNNFPRITIVENKLFARFSNKEKEMLEFDEQVDAYVAALVDGEVEGTPAWELGLIDVDYNVTLKPALRQGKHENLVTYTQRCVADILKRPEHYHRQFHPTRTHEQLQDFRERRDKHIMDLMYEEKMGVWERNPSACFDYGQCPFLKICRSHDGQSIPDGYHKKEERT